MERGLVMEPHQAWPDTDCMPLFLGRCAITADLNVPQWYEAHRGEVKQLFGCGGNE
jgi:hypothetical protein